MSYSAAIAYSCEHHTAKSIRTCKRAPLCATSFSIPARKSRICPSCLIRTRQGTVGMSQSPKIHSLVIQSPETRGLETRSLETRSLETHSLETQHGSIIGWTVIAHEDEQLGPSHGVFDELQGDICSCAEDSVCTEYVGYAVGQLAESWEPGHAEI